MNAPKISFREAAFLSMVVVICAGVRAQGPSKAPAKEQPSPRTAWGGYPFPRSTDAEIADSDVHRVLYEDDQVMFMEVSNPPGLDVHMHGHPYPSVFVHDSKPGGLAPGVPPPPAGGYDTKLDPDSPFNGQGWGEGPPPKGLKYPNCTTSPPQAPHRPFNPNIAPHHFYRLEFKRLDGEEIQTYWKEWYPSMANPVQMVKNLVPGPALGPNFSEQWPYPIAYDSIQAAPNNYQLLYSDGKMRLLEVTIRPGETTPMHGHPYPAVLAFNAISGDPDAVTETKLDPDSPLNGQGAGHGPAPSVFNMKVPTCTTMAPQAPHAIHNGGTAPLHYYRMEFKRIDGDAFIANWRKWYPWMQYMQYMR